MNFILVTSIMLANFLPKWSAFSLFVINKYSSWTNTNFGIFSFPTNFFNHWPNVIQFYFSINRGAEFSPSFPLGQRNYFPWHSSLSLIVIQIFLTQLLPLNSKYLFLFSTFIVPPQTHFPLSIHCAFRNGCWCSTNNHVKITASAQLSTLHHPSIWFQWTLYSCITFHSHALLIFPETKVRSVKLIFL